MRALPDARDRPYHLFTEEYEELRTAVRDLLERRLVAAAGDLERERRFPRALFAELGELGYLTPLLPEPWGAGDPVADAVTAEELGRTGVYGFAAAVSQHRAAGLAIAAGGDDAQCERWLPDLASGRAVWTVAAGEAGLDPDPSHVATQAEPAGDGWRLRGTKAFVPNATEADECLVVARTAERVGLFCVPASTADRLPQDGLAWWECPMGELEWSDTKLPRDARLPANALEVLRHLRLHQSVGEAFALVGLAQRSVDTGIAYGLERRAFDRPVARFQVWRHRWADLTTEVEMARALCVQALRLVAHGEPSDRVVATARLYAGRIAFRTADECVQMHGGYGYMMEFPAQRFWRDARQATVVAGGDLVHLEAIARQLGL